jgi:isoleucyl-tRNA synthetase
MSENNLNLPKTSFSMKANLPLKSQKFWSTWEKMNLYWRVEKKISREKKIRAS